MTNVAKYQFASNYHQAVQMVQDVSGGLAGDRAEHGGLAQRSNRPLCREISGRQRKAPRPSTDCGLMNLISDLTAGDFGGYQEVLAVHAEGSLEAEKLQTYREYDFAAAAEYARELAGIKEG